MNLRCHPNSYAGTRSRSLGFPATPAAHGGERRAEPLKCDLPDSINVIADCYVHLVLLPDTNINITVTDRREIDSLVDLTGCCVEEEQLVPRIGAVNTDI